MNLSDPAETINRSRSALAIVILILVIATACQTATPRAPESTATPFDIVERALRRQQQKWQSDGRRYSRLLRDPGYDGASLLSGGK